MDATQWTPGQLACALEEISRTAGVLERLTLIHQGASVDDDPRDAEALSTAVLFLSQRVGWLADMAAQCAAPGYDSIDQKTPLQWSMPPLFARRARGRDEPR